MCREFGQRPSDMMEIDGTALDRIYFDNYVLTVKSELGAKTKSLDKVNEYVKGFTPRTWGGKKPKYI